MPKWTDYQYRQAKAMEEYAYRRGYDQALAFYLYSVKKFGPDMALARLRRIKKLVAQWRGRFREGHFRKEEPPLSPSYSLGSPKLAKDRKFREFPFQVVECQDCMITEDLLVKYMRQAKKIPGFWQK
jgi:hypothetical protein